jgi:hypothetical protein
MAAVYVPRSPTTGVLYGVVCVHLTDFLATVTARTDGVGLPPFVTAEFRKFLHCGVLAHGFASSRQELENGRKALVRPAPTGSRVRPWDAEVRERAIVSPTPHPDFRNELRAAARFR